MAKHILIGGGTGFIGSSLSKCLKNHGYQVTKISRMPGENRMTWHELERDGIPRDVKAVVNVAGQNVLDPTRRWTPGFRQNVVRSRINTTTALARATAQAEKVDVFVNISGVSHYRPMEKKSYTEMDKVAAFDFMSKLCLDWEQAAELKLAKPIRVVKIRTGVVIGKGGGMMQSIWWPFMLGVGGPLGSGQQMLPWIHLIDLCQLIKHAIENEQVEGVLNGVAPEIVTNAQFSKIFAKLLHRPCLFPVPEFVVKAIFGEERAALLLSGAKIIPKRALDSGFQYKYPTAETALQQVIEGYKAKSD